MKCLVFLSLLLLPLTTTLADPIPRDNWNGGNPGQGQGGGGGPPGHGCLSADQANNLLQTWISFFVKMNPAVGERTIAPEFQFLSDSSNFLALYGQKPIGAVTVSGREAFISAQVNMTANSNGANTFQVLNFFFDCNHFAFRWRLPSPPFALTGIDMVTLRTDGSMLIAKGESEFNTGVEFFDGGICDLTQFGCVPAKT